MSTRLFPGDWRRAGRAAAAVIETPLGSVRLGGEIGGSLLNADQADSYTSLAGPRLLAWNTPAMVAELILGKLPPRSDSEYEKKLMGYHAALWRIRAEKQRLADYLLTCRFEAASHLEGGPCSGESLDAQEWSDGKINLTIGTQDGRAVFRCPGQVPARWLPADSGFKEISHVEYASDGFVLRPPDLEPGEVAQFQFVVAWASEADRSKAWSCVCRKSEWILSVLGSTSCN